jgi:FkbM family methyltransferase
LPPRPALARYPPAALGELIDRARRIGKFELIKLALPTLLAEVLESRHFFRRRGLNADSMLAYRRAWLARLHLLPPDVDLRHGMILDIGANEGDFSAAVLALAPEATIVAVEPSPEPLKRLKARVAGRPNVTIVPKAVAAESGTARFHVTAHDHNASLQQPRSEKMGALYRDEGWGVREVLEVETVSLDELAGGRDVALLKLDVQGGEMKAIRGGREALARTHAVLMEVTFVSHYEGDASFQDLNRAMLDLGFELAGISSPGRSSEGAPAWADACYVRSRST